MSIFQPAPTSAPDRAFLWLRQQIAALPWDREAFLSENAIAEASGISRTPVREALLRLEASGLLRRVPHKGAYIPALTETDIQEIMEVRQVIGEWATRKVAADGLVPADDLEALVLEQEQHLADPVKFIECDITFHQRIVHAAGNPTLAQVYDSQRFKQERLGIQAVLAGLGRSETVLLEHRAIVQAIRDGDPERAAEAVRSHIHSTRSVLGARRTS
ncbi:GntR family transcriptional regulator [Arthrobacter ginkgonis]|uniref:GntR family transcriptional regulator n=1 Tax=Arthrobacter ginkgonis TaxID=1630594 RepID=A0ABP7D6B1_9MICC